MTLKYDLFYSQSLAQTVEPLWCAASDAKSIFKGHLMSTNYDLLCESNINDFLASIVCKKSLNVVLVLEIHIFKLPLFRQLCKLLHDKIPNISIIGDSFFLSWIKVKWIVIYKEVDFKGRRFVNILKHFTW